MLKYGGPMSHYRITIDVLIQEEHLTPTTALGIIADALARGGCFAVIPINVELVKTKGGEGL